MKNKLLANYKIRTQILIFCFTLTTILLGINVGLLYLQFQLTSKNLQNGSTSILNHQYEKSLSTSLNLMQFHYCHQKLQYIKSTEQIGNLFKFLQINKNFTAEMPNNCFQPEKNSSFHQIFCKAFYAPEKYKELQIDYFDKLYNLLSLLDSFILNYFYLYQMGGTIFLTDSSEAAFTAYFPPFTYSGFNPQAIAAYKNHFEQILSKPNQTYYYTPPYSVRKIKASKNLQTALTRSLNLINEEIIGILGHTILTFSTFYDSIPYNILIINQLEQIQMSSVEWQMDQSILNYIYNESQSGFGQEDWNQINRQSMNELFESNCHYQPSGKSMCRFNKILQRELEIQSVHFKETNETLIIMQNMTTSQMINSQFNILFNEIFVIYIKLIYWWIGLCVISYSISLIFIQLIQRSWQRIMRTSKIFVKSFGNNTNKNIFTFLNTYNKRENLSSKLEQSFYRLYDTLTSANNKKCQQCKDIQNFQYNHKGTVQECQFYTSQILENIDKINNFPPLCVDINFIQQCLKQQ